MKKTNKKGFTLVELIVVVCIFGIILGAILNFIKPANEIHKDTQATMDANIMSSGIIEYMDDELRYATNILVLEDYAGVPNVSATGQVGTCPVTFTNCLVLDCKNPRGYCLKNYTSEYSNKTAAKMGATGCVIKVNKLGEGGFNFNNSSVAKGVDFYDNFKYDIRTGTSINEVRANPKLRTIQVNVITYEPEYKNGKFVFEKKKFDRDKVYSADEEKEKSSGAVINLTNINIAGSDFKLRGDLKCKDPVLKSIVEDNYPNATSAPAGATAEQKSYYSAKDDNRYTYIFYQKAANASASKLEVKMVYSNSHPVTALQGKQIGATSYVKKGTTFKSFSTPSAMAGYLPPYWLAPDGSKVDTSKGYVISENTTFTLVYEPESSVPTYEVTWLQPDGSEFTKNNAFENHAPISPGVPDQVDTDKQDFIGWYRQGSGEEYSTVKVTGSGLVFVPKVENKVKVEFTSDEAGENVIAECTTYISKGGHATAPSTTPAPPDADKIFDKWVVKDHPELELSTYEIPSVASVRFVPTFKDKPSDINGWSITYSVNNQGTDDVWTGSAHAPANKLDIMLTFHCATAGKKLNNYSVKVTFDSNATIYYASNVDITGNGSKTITMKIASDKLWSNIYDGSTHNLNNQFKIVGGNIVNVELLTAN